MPRSARICAGRVVEYVPQNDEEVTPKPFDPPERLRPIEPSALPAEAEESEPVSDPPAIAGMEGAPLDGVDEYEPSEPWESADEFYEELFPVTGSAAADHAPQRIRRARSLPSNPAKVGALCGNLDPVVTCSGAVIS